MGSESHSFPRLLALLRKEEGFSQKQAASELGISQALLSHYEKGIRTPGLEFIVRCANYYDVSCDYLLGRSPDRRGLTLTVEDIASPEIGGTNQGIGSVFTQLNRKLIANSQNVLFDILTRLENKSLTREISTYLMLAVYRVFRVVYSSNPKNNEEMFAVPSHVLSQYVSAAMQLVESHAQAIASGKPMGKDEKIKRPEDLVISTEYLGDEYPLFVSSLTNLIAAAEKQIALLGKAEK